jgi:LysM repeat protein
MNTPKRLAWLVVGLAVWLSGCQVIPSLSPSPVSTQSGTFSLYQTKTTTPIPPGASITPSTSTPLPSPTVTPRTHVVKSGEDMSGIALRYRVTLAALQAANPGINPRLMPIGTVLIIPPSADISTAAVQFSATAQPVLLDSPSCYPDQAGGIWCFVIARNSGENAVANVAAKIRVTDASGKQAAQQTAWLALDVLPVGKAIPLMAYFPAPLPSSYQVGVQLDTVLPARLVDERYPAVSIVQPKVTIALDRMSADANGSIRLTVDKSQAKTIWVLLVAYRNDGRVVGIRRWESSQGLAAGQSVDFEMTVYSAGPAIERVELFVEARK